MARRVSEFGAKEQAAGRNPADRGRAANTRDGSPVAMVRDLPSNYFAVGRMHDHRSFMLIDSKEVLGNARASRK
jgi:hypothetical protein